MTLSENPGKVFGWAHSSHSEIQDMYSCILVLENYLLVRCLFSWYYKWKSVEASLDNFCQPYINQLLKTQILVNNCFKNKQFRKKNNAEDTNVKSAITFKKGILSLETMIIVNFVMNNHIKLKWTLHTNWNCVRCFFHHKYFLKCGMADIP